MASVSGQFLAGIPLPRLQTELSTLTNWDKQLEFLNETVLHPVLQEYPLKWSYQIAFLKRCIAVLEAWGVDIRDEFYETLVALQQKESSCPQKWIYSHYLLPQKDTIVTIKESPQIVSEGTTGLSCWQAGIFLADWMTQNPEKFTGKRLLELGSGTGSTGLIVCRTCGPKELILSDCHVNVLRLLRDNVELNACQDTVRVIDLDWADPDQLDNLNVDPELILAADVVYDDTVFKLLVDLLLTFTRRNKAVQIYLAATVRNQERLSRFLQLTEDSGLATTEIVSSKDVPNLMHWDDRTEIKLYLITGKGV